MSWSLRGTIFEFIVDHRAVGLARRALFGAFAAGMLSGCHGSTLDAIYPGTLGHDPPPAFNLPPQDQGLERL